MGLAEGSAIGGGEKKQVLFKSEDALSHSLTHKRTEKHPLRSESTISVRQICKLNSSSSAASEFP